MRKILRLGMKIIEVVTLGTIFENLFPKKPLRLCTTLSLSLSLSLTTYQWKKRRPRRTTTSSPVKAKEPPDSSKASASPLPSTVTPLSPRRRVPLSSAASLGLQAPPKPPSPKRIPNSNRSKTSSRSTQTHPKLNSLLEFRDAEVGA